jgi:hypothetical protein
MPRREVGPHYIRRNDSDWTPPVVIYLDTETKTIPGILSDVLTMRLWCARLVDRRPRNASIPDVVNANGSTATELVAWIEKQFAGRKTIWLFAHNLSFDLATTRLPLVLADAGWEVNDAAIGGRAPWVRMGKGSRVLTIVDSGSWLPVKLETVGAMVGIAKPDLPDEDDSKHAWLARCRADVDILAAAMGQLLDWWDREQLGHFNITGPACGWNAFRHVWTVQRIMVNPDPSGVQADRLAVHGGRRGVWKVGQVQLGPLLEIDIRGAYPGVAAHLPLPVRRVRAFDSLGLDDPLLVSDRWGIAAEVELDTDTPRWPVRWRGATWYPVGRFKAHLAGPEIAEAARLGCLRSIGPGHVHQLGPVLMSWAKWVLAVQDNPEGRHPAVAGVLAKHWGRTVIGRFSTRGYDKIEMGGSPVAGWGYEEGWDHATGTRGGYVDMAGKRWWVSGSTTSDNAYPAVLAWVESHVRLRLSRVCAALPVSALVQCDTDGLIVTEAGLIALGKSLVGPHTELLTDTECIGLAIQYLNTLTHPLELRVKRSFESARVLGPQHVEAGGERRFSGLPRTARNLGADRYEAKLWPKLQWQLAHGDTRGYVRPVTNTTVKGPFANGWVTSTGRVLPVRFYLSESGESLPMPYDWDPLRDSRPELSPDQHRALNTLINTG